MFDLNRRFINSGGARDVQAVINAASANLPGQSSSKPNYRKTNPADAPIMILAITSDISDRGKMYDIASSVLQQKLSQVEGGPDEAEQFPAGGAARGIEPHQGCAWAWTIDRSNRHCRRQCQPAERFDFPAIGTRLSTQSGATPTSTSR